MPDRVFVIDSMIIIDVDPRSVLVVVTHTIGDPAQTGRHDHHGSQHDDDHSQHGHGHSHHKHYVG